MCQLLTLPLSDATRGRLLMTKQKGFTISKLSRPFLTADVNLPTSKLYSHHIFFSFKGRSFCSACIDMCMLFQEKIEYVHIIVNSYWRC